MMQTCGAGSNWGSAGSSTGQVCILGKQASLVAACKRFIRPQVTCKLRKSTGGPCACDVPWWSVCMRLPLPGARAAWPQARPAGELSPPPPPGGRFLLRDGPAAQLHRKHRRGPGRRRVASGGYHVRPHCPRATYPFTSYIGGVQSPLAPCGRACIDSRAARPSR